MKGETPRAKRPRFLFIITAVAVLIIIAIVVPSAILLPRRKHHNKSEILLPLYIYPESNNTWKPLYDSVEEHTHLQFTVIINPNSGPGNSKYPNDQYSAEITKLNGYPNVKTVGYVRTGYATRNLTDVVAEVSTYAAWATKSNNLAMHGIFFDEAPHEYSADAVDFMQKANAAVKGASGLQGQKTIIHNPGVVPDARYHDPNTDISVIFEEAYAVWDSKLASIDAQPKNRSAYSIMVHSVPTLSMADLKKYVNELSNRAEHLFLTHNNEGVYESFGSQWANFTSVVPT
ncbi:spherulin 4-like cell surface protein [Clohesyomyces aquaticus]|uniref:Spherulin 4-like cell surface protein n=1 Tax=Clohesyomyces aquaticus TaxID=1231657 RepID=A0A1Y2A8Z5_9PLEO|nr:spherulin 4-like cell surface protein [Clohesyomyces aquaticus]